MNFNPFNFAQSLVDTDDPNVIQLSKKLPPIHLWNPNFCGEIPMRIARDGIWYYQNTPFTRHRMVQLFSRILRREEDGYYYLVTPVEKVRIQVDDVPFVASQVEKKIDQQDNKQRLIFTTQVGDSVIADQAHPLVMKNHNDQNIPYILVRDQLQALIHRNVYYQLIAWAEPCQQDKNKWGVWSSGLFFELGKLDTIE